MSHPLVEQLAMQHSAHLRWLAARVGPGLGADEIEDVLQGAYARALAALSRPTGQRPSFAALEPAVAWLRTIALNHAHDVARQRHGRGQHPRPAAVSLDEVASAGVAADDDPEDEVLRALESQANRPVVLEAIGRLDPRHREILQLRYGRGLAPAAVMVLAGLDRRQWEGRHTRALKAFGRALARQQLSGECRQTRTILRRRPATLLDRSGQADDHVSTCLACGAFAQAARFAVASLPLPLAIEAWRFDAVEALTGGPPRHASLRGDGHGAAPDLVASSPSAAPPVAAITAVGAPLAVLAGALAAAALALSGLERSEAGPLPRAKPASNVAEGSARGRTRLAAHQTPAQALERSARRLARRRGQAARRTPAPGGAHASRRTTGVAP